MGDWVTSAVTTCETEMATRGTEGFPIGVITLLRTAVTPCTDKQIDLVRRFPDFRGRLIGDLVLRGKTEAMRAFDPVRGDRFDDAMTDSYTKAVGLLEANDSRAIAAFATHVGRWAGDQTASFHLKRLLNGATGTRIELG